ncbi:MAG: bifunctional nuclease family protein [Deltaproteobacteria bacterium]|nr:MAG: bifunctional nuclease family protein [Deltaproteobacteria bacterium]TMB33466.1 MAG: bifunctional nuclease family protein [Deltaproteobacteria bacterium]
MAGGRRVRPITIAALLLVLGGGTVQAVREWRDLWAEGHVALSVTEVVRLHGDRSVVVLQNRSHARRLPIPVTAQEGTAIERRLHPGAPHSLVARAIDALGSHIVRVAIDVDPAGGLNGTVVVARGLFGSRELPVETGEAIRLALDEGAPIETSRDLLEVAGVSEEEARTLALDSARGRAPEADSMPVHTF